MSLQNNKCPVCGKELKPFINHEGHSKGIVVRAWCCERSYFAVVKWQDFVEVKQEVIDRSWEELMRGDGTY